MPKIWSPEPALSDALYASIPDILDSQRENGQFGSEPWICRDQHSIYPLAAAWMFDDSPFHGDDRLLQAIVTGGNALIEAQDENGMWTFLKKDYSTWGQIYMPWTYSRWIRAFQIVREAMDPDSRARWEQALLLGFEGIARTTLDRIHNIPTHHAMALYCAGMVFKREDWRTQARDFIHKVAEAQSPFGWWTENVGPVVAYNYVYSDAIGVYYKLSGDVTVLGTLDRAARYHANYVYPSGSAVETVDERNTYSPGIRLGNPGFSYSTIGRGYLSRQHRLLLEAGETLDVDYATNLLLYAGEGPTEETPCDVGDHAHRMGDSALIVAKNPWFTSLSAYACPINENRFRQDRQNFVSLFHERTGLIVGGGNTKLQPRWSTFTFGDPSLMAHRRGDEAPNFGPFEGLVHIPVRGEIGPDNRAPTVLLNYGAGTGTVRVLTETDDRARLIYQAVCESDLPARAHITLIAHPGERVLLSDSEGTVLGQEHLQRDGEDGLWLTHHGWRIALPEGSRLLWPALPHNPYRKAGDATFGEGRLAIELSFDKDRTEFDLELQII